MMKKGKKIEQGYATSEEGGVNYRDIADTMTAIGYKMNHSSARNYVLRVMRKFIDEIADQYDIKLSDDAVDSIARSPLFQSGIADLLHDLEVYRKSSDYESNKIPA